MLIFNRLIFTIRSKVWGGEEGGGRWKKSEWKEKIVTGFLTLGKVVPYIS